MKDFVPLLENMFALVKSKNYFRFCRAIAVSSDLTKVIVYSSPGMLSIYPLRPTVDAKPFPPQPLQSEVYDPDETRVIQIFHINDIDERTDEFWQVCLAPYIKKDGSLTFPDGRHIEIRAGRRRRNLINHA